jgi:hypothetical protein
MLKRALLSLALCTAVIVSGAGTAVSASASTVSPSPKAPHSHVLSTKHADPLVSKPHGVFANSDLGAVVGKLKAGASVSHIAGAHVIDGRLRVEVLHSAKNSIAAALHSAGAADIRTTTATVTTADVPYTNLEKLQTANGVSYVRLPQSINAVPTDGGVSADQDAPIQQGADGADIVTKTNAAAWHNAGWTGTGESIAIIDGGFNQDIYNSDVASGELPTVAGTFCEDTGVACSAWQSFGVHGDAVAEIVHDEAPGAKIYFAVANTLQDYEDAITYFSDHGVSVVTRSLGTILDGPGDGTGPSDAVQNDAVKAGITWFNSAGNQGIIDDTADGYHYGGYWRGKWNPWPMDGDAFQGVETFQTGAYKSQGLLVECGYFEGLRWNDWGLNRTDYDLLAVTDDGSGTVITSSTNDQTAGAPPIEGQNFDQINCSDYPDYYLVIELKSVGNGTADDNLELMTNSAFFDYSTTGDLLSDSYSATDSFVDSSNPGAPAIGAVDPVGGTVIGDYSAQGPTNDGRIKPDLSAAAGGITAAYGPGEPFHGTSAATPLAASAALLVLESHPGDTPAQLVAEIESHDLVDRGVAGTDNVYGHGELVLGTVPTGGTDAPPLVLSPTPVPTITGTASSGHKLTAHAGAWGPSKVTLSYQWLRDGANISKATKSTYALTSSDAGDVVTVAVRGAKTGYPSVNETSLGKSIALLKFSKTKTPTISGTAKVGRTLKVSTGSTKWKPKPSNFTFQWFETDTASGKLPIAGATSSSYVLQAGDVGKKITVAIVASKTHYASVSKTSSATKAVIG